MDLFGLKIPTQFDDRLPMYLNVTGSFDNEKYILKNGSKLSFDTYFGCFSVSKYLKYTTLTKAKLVFVYCGKIVCEIVSSATGTVSVNEFESVKPAMGEVELDFANAGENEIWYPKFVSLDDNTRFLGGIYRADAEPKDIKVAFITCTYKRESFVIDTAERMAALLEDSDIKDSFEFLIVDNGKSLEGKLPVNDKIHLYYNKNTGGSGGFTRGMIEAYHQGGFTHVLMMDDDISFDENVIIKTVTTLQLLKSEYSDICLAGGMLKIDDPTSQFEAGARRMGINISNKSLRLDNMISLLANDKEEHADYGGWWYYCMPISFVSDQSLPMPYFIKDDDVEFSLRNKAKVVVMNGVGVWHQDFSAKYVPYLDYYMVRNGLITNSIYHLKTSTGGTGNLIFERICRSIIYKMPDANRFYSMALRDFIKGPQFFYDTDSELLNTELRCIESRQLPELPEDEHERTKLMLKAVFTAAFWKVLGMYISASVKYLIFRVRACREYPAEFKKMTSLETWQKILELDK